MKRHWLPTVLATLLSFGRGELPSVRAELPPLVTRLDLFRPPERSAPRLSPDGTRLAWIASANGRPNLWFAPVAGPAPAREPRLLSRDLRGSVRQPVWQSDGEAVLYLQDSDGQGNWHVMQAHIPTGNIRDLTPFHGVQARVVAVSPRLVDQILVAFNLRDRRFQDVYRIDLNTGATFLEAENTGEVTTWFADDDLTVRLAQVILPGGEFALSTRSDPRSIWRPMLRWGTDDALGKVFGFGPGGSNFWLVSSVRAPAPRLLDVNLAGGTTAVLAQDPRYDVAAALVHPFSRTLQAVQFSRARAQWRVADTNVYADLETLRRYRDADLDVLDRDLTDRHWIVSFTADNAPLLYALYQRTNGLITPLYSENPALEAARLARTRTLELTARDGLHLEGYLTLPDGLEPKGLPAVVLVHGGPWSRTLWGFDPEVQWLANRGYAVIQVNFRGSTGYGKDHLNAGDQEWGGKILLDLVDARQWAVDQGIVDPKRVAIMGSGFGGFAATAALAMHPDLFAAGINRSGPVNLTTMVNAVPTNAPALRAVVERRIGRTDSTAARQKLLAQSPVSRAALIKAPLLIAATAHDPQAPVGELDAFVAAMRREGRSPEFLIFPDEGAVLRDPASQRRFHAAAEAFLARHLGGRVEPPAHDEAYEALRR